jgi:Fe-S-cluster containining protein
VITLHRRVDEVLATTIEGHGVKVACARGCSYCCSLRVQGAALRGIHSRRVAEAQLRTRRAWRESSSAPDGNVARTRELGEERRKRTNIACALLGEDGACTAYEARPAQCRRYHSTDVETLQGVPRQPRRERSRPRCTRRSRTTPT